MFNRQAALILNDLALRLAYLTCYLVTLYIFGAHL